MTTQHAQRSWRSVLHALENLRDVVRDSTKEINDALCTHDGDWDKETRRPDGPMFFRCCQCGADLGNVGDRERPKPAELVAADAPDRIWIDDRGMWTPSPSIGAGDGSDGFGPFPEYVRVASAQGPTYYTDGKNAEWFEALDDQKFVWEVSKMAMDLADMDTRGLEDVVPFIGVLSDAASRIERLMAQPSVFPAELNADLIEILGRPNFTCGRIAATFRAAGRTIKTRAEDEQAFVLHWLLGLYLKHGAEWRDRAEEELRAATNAAMEAAAQREPKEKS